MIKYDKSPAAFNPPDLNFLQNYTGAILIFDDATWDELLTDAKLTGVHSRDGKVYENFRGYKQDNGEVLLIYPNAGASAAIIDFELLIASGIKHFVGFGTCGVFDKEIPQNSIIVPTTAIREEGTSYHYLPEDSKVYFSDELVKKMLKCAQKYNIATNVGAIWTTDAVYRETENKIMEMKNSGCIGVDMELSALMAVAQYRKVEFAQFLIVDDLVPPSQVARLTDNRKAETYLSLAIDILGTL